MEKNKNIQKLISNRPSSWKERSDELLNKPWLKEYSSEIAKRIVAAINESDGELNQTRLAEKLGVERQQVSKIIKGQENLTLETIYKISKALNIQLITFPTYKYSELTSTGKNVYSSCDITTNAVSTQADISTEAKQESKQEMGEDKRKVANAVKMNAVRDSHLRPLPKVG